MKEIVTILSEAKPKRKFWHPVNHNSYSPGMDLPQLKDGFPEPFEDLYSLPERKVEYFDDEGNKTGEEIFPAKYSENQHSLNLRSLKTGEVSCFVKWPKDYFGDKGRGPFTTEKKGKEGKPIRKNMKFDGDGKRM